MEPTEDAKPTKLDKRHWAIASLDVFAPVIDVFQWASHKYGRMSWKLCKPSEVHARYWSAMMRHLEQHSQGEWLDKESGMPHLAHAASNILIVLWHGIRNDIARKF